MGCLPDIELNFSLVRAFTPTTFCNHTHTTQTAEFHDPNTLGTLNFIAKYLPTPAFSTRGEERLKRCL